MVTFDISTDLNMANGADIELDEREEASVLVSMNRTKATALDVQEPGVLLMAPLTRTFVLATTHGKRTLISRQQLAITPACTFTNYRAQAQTIEYCVVDIGTPPSGQFD